MNTTTKEGPMKNLIKEETEQKLSDDDIEKAYSALGKSTEFWIVVGRGAFCFRFGPS